MEFRSFKQKRTKYGFISELDRSTTLVEANSVCSNVLQSEGRNNKTNSDICISPQNDSIIVGDRTLNYRFPDKTPNSELALVDDFSTQMQNMNDNYILVLKPKVSNGLWLNYDEELPTCSLTFDHQGSFLTSTNVGHHIDETQCKNNGDHNTSDSDTWSAPDIGVSQQRIGLENTQLFSPQSNKRFWLSPRKRDSGVTDSSSSSVAPVSAKGSLGNIHTFESMCQLCNFIVTLPFLNFVTDSSC